MAETTRLQCAPARAAVEELAAAAVGEGVGLREIAVETILWEAAFQF